MNHFIVPRTQLLLKVSKVLKINGLYSASSWSISRGIDFPDIGLVGRVFANGPVNLGSIPSRAILKTLKMVLDTSLLNTQQYKVYIKGKVRSIHDRKMITCYSAKTLFDITVQCLIQMSQLYITVLINNT